MNARTFLLTALWLGTASAVFSQGELTLDRCYELARTNFPLIKQKELVTRSKEYSVANAKTGYFPQLSITGQATYQSDVTKVPIEVPGFTIKTLPKDQYRIYAEVNQALYDGGSVRRQAALQETAALVEDQKVEVELYRIKERINQLFFGTLLIDEQLALVALVSKDLEASAKKMEASIQNGVAFKTNLDILNAEQLKNRQREIELKAGRSSYLAMLSVFINQELGEQTKLARPAEQAQASDEATARPEITLYNYQSQLITAQQQFSNTRVLPRLNMFVQAGYGRPGLNMLNSEFASYYLGGLRLSWNLTGFYNTNRDKQQLEANLEGIGTQRETFLFNTRLSMRQQKTEVDKLRDLIEVDEQIIALREKITVTSKSQLDNGVVTANDYLRELNAEDQAKQNLAVHRIQLLTTQYNLRITAGDL